MLTKILESLPNTIDSYFLDQSISSFERTYAQILYHYFNGDVHALIHTPLSFATLEEKNLLEALRDCRLVIRSLGGSISDEQLQVLKAASRGRDALAGEVNMVLAMYEETKQNEAESFQHYKLAYDLFSANQCQRRAVRALHNAFACQSRIDPTRRLLVEYNRLVARAKACEDWITAGAALTNISREFQTMGLFYAALRYADEAVDLLKINCALTQPYYLALLHRAHVAYDLKMQSLMLADLEESSVAPFPEVLSAAKAFQDKIAGKAVNAEQLAHCNATWKERIQGEDNRGKELGELEQGIICALTQGPKTRYELIECVYPGDKNLLALENRLKQLLHRLRKKYPGMIGKSGRHYCLLERNAIPTGLVI